MMRRLGFRLSRMAVLVVLPTALMSCGGDGAGPGPVAPPTPNPPGPNVLPAASFSLSAQEGAIPFTVTFDASASSDPDGTLVSYAWTFGDGGTGSGSQTSHTFDRAGQFQVQLTVRDDRSGEAVVRQFVFAATPAGVGPNAIEGMVWFDRNLDGVRGAGESGLDRFVLFLDEDGDEGHDPGEALTFSEPDGSYSFLGLDADRSYTVTQLLPFGWSNTTPGLPAAGPAGRSAPAQIINGDKAEIVDFPFQVALMQGNHQFCGGTVVNSNWVLTAAHCVDEVLPGDFEVLIGTQMLSSGGERVGVEAIRMHPDFSTSFDGDVALVRVSKPLLLPRPFVQTPDQLSLSLPGVTATAIGWGEIEDGSQPNLLRRVEIPIITDEICSEVAGVNSAAIGDRTICAGVSNGAKGVCFGDSGGPLLVPFQGSWLQIGISSFLVARDNCGDVPSAFARVSSLFDYIFAVAKTELSGSYVVEWNGASTVNVDFGNFH